MLVLGFKAGGMKNLHVEDGVSERAQHWNGDTKGYQRIYAEYFPPTVLCTPSPPTKSFPTKSPRVELSGRLPEELYGHENSHPLDLRVCLSQTLRNPNS